MTPLSVQAQAAWLVVDDEPAKRRTIGRVLNQLGLVADPEGVEAFVRASCDPEEIPLEG